jgi:hypothetical protein
MFLINSPCIHHQEVETSRALTFSPPTFSPSDNSTNTVGPSDNWTLELFDPHLFGPYIV